MPVTLELRENGRVLHYTFTDPWEIGDLTALYPKSLELLRSANGRLYTLADVRTARRIPSGLLNLRHGPEWSHPNGGAVAVVGASALLRTFASIVFRLSRFEQARFFDDEDEAWLYLHRAMAAEAQTPTATE
jgi:hypothetical protein